MLLPRDRRPGPAADLFFEAKSIACMHVQSYSANRNAVQPRPLAALAVALAPTARTAALSAHRVMVSPDPTFAVAGPAAQERITVARSSASVVRCAPPPAAGITSAASGSWLRDGTGGAGHTLQKKRASSPSTERAGRAVAAAAVVAVAAVALRAGVVARRAAMLRLRPR